MKKILAIVLAAVMVMGLAACGSSTTTTAAPSGDQGGTQDQEAAAGETVDVGDFTVLVPSGWMKYPQEDIFSDADADGNYPILTDAYGMIKGGKDEWDALTEPTIYINYYSDLSAETQVESAKIWYDEPQDIEVEVNGTKCPGIEGGSLGYTYQIVYIPVSDSSCVQVMIPKDMDGTAGVTVDDSDVKAILESIKVK